MLYPTETEDDEGASLKEVGEEACGEEACGEEEKIKDDIFDMTEEKDEKKDLLDEEVELLTFSSSSLILILE